MSEDKNVGDNGFTDLEETSDARRYADYHTYTELKKLGWDKKRIAEDMHLTESALDAIIDEFEEGEEPEEESDNQEEEG